MHSISLCFVWFTILVIVTSSDSFTSLRSNDAGIFCDGSGWSGYLDEKCYKLIQKWATREEAKDVCAQEELESDGSIPQMAKISSSAEQTFLTAYVFDTSAVTISVWIGAIRQNGSDFIWDDGTDVAEFTNWTEDSPSDKIQQSCVVMKSDYMKSQSSTAGQWRDVPCAMPNYVLCEKPPRWSITKLQQTQLAIRKELKASNELLDETRNELSITKNQLSQTKSRLDVAEAEIQETKEKLVPIGFLYTQLPYQKTPLEIWPSLSWLDVSSVYSGVFFRVFGSGTAPFGQVQSDNAPEIYSFTVFSDGPTVTLNNPTHQISSINESIRLTNKYVSGLRFSASYNEVRPYNMAVRIWERIE